MLILGLTGSLGTGKTTVAKMFFDLGAKVMDADAIAHRLMRRGGTAFKPIVRYFGKKILEAGEIDRKKLAEIVFNDAQQLDKLGRVIHPLVAKEMKDMIANLKRGKAKQTIVLDVPLLIEASFNEWVDYVVVVKANRKMQLDRAVQSMGLTRAEAVKRLHVQMPILEKIRRADIIIDNRGNLTETKKQVRKIWQKLQRKKQ